MKEESVLNVLMYLFKNHIHDKHGLNLGKPLLSKLESIGFHKTTIDQAFNWLNNLIQIPLTEMIVMPKQESLRVYNEFECDVLNVECRNLLILLEKQGILNAQSRELIVHQSLLLEPEGIDIELFKWVILMVLFNQPDEKNALACMEFLVLDDVVGGIH